MTGPFLIDILHYNTDQNRSKFILFTDKWVKKRLQTLRNSYTKAKKSATSGSARKNVTKRIIWLLEKLKFLEPHIAARTSVSNLDSVSMSYGAFFAPSWTNHFLLPWNMPQHQRKVVRTCRCSLALFDGFLPKLFGIPTKIGSALHVPGVNV